MNKIQVRCVRGFGMVGFQHNIEVLRPLTGFGYSKRLYCCTRCGELFVLDLDNPALKGSRNLPKNIAGKCPQCQVLLKDHLCSYPENVFLSGHVNEMDASTISYDYNSSTVQELWLIDID